ncbi:non-ribosomal peptide synthetase, partial [Longimicrobium sp.]|uniref:non-ribosomal peptide synthetase n=1 Tax=Longimicrobium sp. TaxID=2029185 RepID=UPI002E30A807
FLGRVDAQVKVRGFRIEPGEVEAALLSHEGVREAVVVARADGPGEARLVGYVVAADGSDGAASPSAEGLRSHLRARLPEHMVPSAFVRLDALPLTPNGKVDRRALPALEQRPGAAYVAPRTEVEALLCALWAETLRVDRVGVEESFLELGGDSILSIQLVARARARGLRITPRQVFECPTVARLAEVAERVDAPAPAAADAALVTGTAPLTPVQHRFFAQAHPAPHHYNQALLLVPRAPLDPARLEQAVAALVTHHYALRLRFHADAAGAWTQAHASPDEHAPVERVRLADVAEADQPAAIGAEAERAQRALDLAAGPLLRVVSFDLGEGRPERLLIVIHHLVVDGVSWRILLEDLETAYEQLVRGEPVRLPEKTTSWQAWAGALADCARAVDADEAAYWLEEAEREVAPLPLDDPSAENTVARSASVAVHLDAGETEALLREVPRAHGTQIDEVLLCALVQALGRWTGSPRVRVELEGHGREEDRAPGVDLSRTVGWFTSLYPVVLDLSDAGAGDADAALRAVKEQLRAVPGRGLGHGLLRWLRADYIRRQLQRAPAAEVAFNYLGQMDQAVSADAFLAFADEPAGAVADGRGLRGHRVDVTASVRGGRLEVEIGYAEGVHRRETMERLAAWYGEALRGLIARGGGSPPPAGGTPADVPPAGGGPAERDAPPESAPDAEAVYPLTPMQEGMLFHALYAPGAGVYVGQFGFVLEGGLDADALERAWREGVARHQALRASFTWEHAGRPLQVIHRAVELPFHREDWRDTDEAGRQARLRAYLAADRDAGIDPRRAPLMRLALFRTGDDAHLLAWTHHHLVLDGWSLSVLFRDVLALYGAARRGARAELPAPWPYGDYVAWLRGRDPARAEAYWRGVLGGVTAPTPLPLLPRAAGARAIASGQAWLRLGPERSRALDAACRRLGVTASTLVQGAWGLLLARYAGEDEALFGATVSGRPAELPGAEEIVGLFINALPVRVRAGGATTVRAWLGALQAEGARAREHQYTPLVQLQKWSGLAPGEPLFESQVTFENYPLDPETGERVEGLRARTAFGLEQTSVPLVLTVMPGARMEMLVRYDPARAGADAMERLAGHLDAVLEGLVAGPDRPLSEVSLLRADERDRVVQAWNATDRPFPDGTCLHALVEAQAARTPDAPAVVFGGRTVGYAALERQATRVARALARRGVGPERRVGLCMEPGPAAIAALLGVLKAGGAYVPLDPSVPPGRMTYLLADSGAVLVVATAATAGRVAGYGVPVLEVGDDPFPDEPESPLPARADADNLAYVIYTSGSTGLPKGVMVPHRGVCNAVAAFAREYAVGGGARVLLFAPLHFDASVLDIFVPLATGAALVAAPRDELLPGEPLTDLLRRQRVTHAKFTPSALAATPRVELPDLRVVVTGGEACTAGVVARWAPGRRFVNGYGPTETSVRVSVHPTADGTRPPPLGRPLDNVRFYVVDGALGPVPVGVGGELCIAGVAVTRGYLGRPALTAERFVPDPFSARRGTRMYRSGDRVRWNAAGEVEFIGRMDGQVKIRGVRIETGEVEAALRLHPAVRDAAVVAREDVPGEARLVAYVVPADTAEAAPGAAALRAHLREHLPESLVPSAFVSLDRLPLNANDKLDRRALPAPEWEPAAEYAAPSTPAEAALCAAWAEVLRVPRVGVHDGFFELGGDSILSIQLVARARARGLRITPRQLFEHATVARLAQVAEPVDAGASPVQAPVTGGAPLTPVQHRFFSRAHPAPHHYNQALLLVPRAPLDPARLEQAVAALVTHHDALRLRFHADGAGAWTQAHASPDEHAPVERVRLAHLAEADQPAAIEAQAERAQRGLDLGAGPLLRVVSFDLGEGRPERLLIVIHHLVVDGVSWRILLEDLETTYEQLSRGESIRLPEKTTSWQAWARALADSAA